MDIEIENIKAFIQIYESGTFSAAAKKIGLSQPALSLKISRLEDSLCTSLFIRHPRKLELTASGRDLLVYAREVLARQEEFLQRFDQYGGQELTGVIRIAGFSSIMRSMILPKLASFLRENKKVSIEFSSYEVFELEDVLKTNKADFIITDYYPKLSGVEEVQISEEEYVIIQSKKLKDIPEKFLDHGPSDNATDTFLKFIGYKKKYQRAFMGDVYSIIDAVSLGLGKAVMSKHLIEKDKRFIIQKNKRRYIRPVVLSYLSQGYYSPLHQKVLEILKK